jgi:type IV pilus assembly protein PilY1
LDTLAGTDNGLSEPALLDTNGDRIIDVIYAGDLNGKVWKFDVSGNANLWDSAYKSGSTPVPLFAAAIGATVQPITGALEIGAPPNNTGGFMIYFGTGRYLGNTDIGNTATQTAYGILDSGTAITTGRAALVSQSFVFEGPRSATDSSPVRVVSNNAVTYVASGNSVTPRGWFLDLLSPNSPNNLGERIISVPLLRQGRAIFTSIIPSSAPCEQGGFSWITEVDAMTGARLAESVFDYTGDDLFNLSDYATYVVGGTTVDNPVSSKKLVGQGLLKSPTVISAGEKEYKVGSGTAGGVVVITEKGMSGTPRSSWRQLFGQ